MWVCQKGLWRKEWTRFWFEGIEKNIDIIYIYILFICYILWSRLCLNSFQSESCPFLSPQTILTYLHGLYTSSTAQGGGGSFKNGKPMSWWDARTAERICCCCSCSCNVVTSKLQKMALTLLTWKCAWRHNGVHFFDIESPLERPKLLRTPQSLHFWLPNVLRATTPCTFSTSQLPKVPRTLSF